MEEAAGELAIITLTEAINKDTNVAHKITQKTCGTIVGTITALMEAEWAETWLGSLKTCWAKSESKNREENN